MLAKLEGKNDAAIAEALRAYVRDQMLPYWYDTTLDREGGGYRLADRYLGSWSAQPTWRGKAHFLLKKTLNVSIVRARSKHLVSQARLLYVFSLAHRLGYSDERRSYLEAAGAGYKFLVTHMLDPQYGGCYWSTDLKGNAIHPWKFLYGQAFAVFALVEYYRASGLADALSRAYTLYRKVQETLHDEINSGWIEHAERDFSPMPAGALEPVRGRVGIVGLKSCNAHAHWLEALAELYAETQDPAVRSAAQEALEIVLTRFLPPNVAGFREYRKASWEPVDGEHFRRFSYGHLVEYAWFAVWAQEAVGISPAWEHFNLWLRYALEHGFDHERGGFYAEGLRGEPAIIADDTKLWWVQAEGLSALCHALSHGQGAGYRADLNLLLDWIFRYQVLPEDGVWIWGIDPRGRMTNLIKAGEWKAAYHEFRALLKCIDLFSHTAEAGASSRQVEAPKAATGVRE